MTLTVETENQELLEKFILPLMFGNHGGTYPVMIEKGKVTVTSEEEGVFNSLVRAVLRTSETENAKPKPTPFWIAAQSKDLTDLYRSEPALLCHLDNRILTLDEMIKAFRANDDAKLNELLSDDSLEYTRVDPQ